MLERRRVGELQGLLRLQGWEVRGPGSRGPMEPLQGPLSPHSPPRLWLRGAPLFTDTVAFRVAPWIMTNTQPLEVYVCR